MVSIGQSNLPFELAAIPIRAFLHLLTMDDQRRALACICEHLADDGRLIFNIFDPNLEMIAGPFGPLGPSEKRQSEFVRPDTGRRVIVCDTNNEGTWTVRPSPRQDRRAAY